MRPTPIKDMFVGIGIAILAASIYSVFFVLDVEEFYNVSGGDAFTLLILIPAIGLFHTFWFVIPFGAALGVAIPEIVSKKNLSLAIIQGIVLGVLFSALIAVFLYILSLRDYSYLKLMIYTTVWTSAYAVYAYYRKPSSPGAHS